MSDIFDHEGDAMDDLLFGRTADEGVPPRFTNLGRRGSYTSHRASESKTCKFCGAVNLHWAKFNGQWRLADGSNMHTCKEYTPDVVNFDEFFNVQSART